MAANYKRVWRALREFALEDSLQHLWHYSRLVSGSAPLPPTYDHRDADGTARVLENHVHPHEIDVLARELVLHADVSGKPARMSLANWHGASVAFNAIKEYANGVVSVKDRDSVMLTLHRIAQQQLPRFSRLSATKVGRYLALYRSPQLAKVFIKKIGIPVDSYFALAFAVYGSALRSARMNTRTDYSILGIDGEQSTKFYGRLVGDVDKIRDKLREDQRLNDCWEYTFNALHFLPLVSLDKEHPERVYCPVPSALEARLFDGIFYSLGPDNAYGPAFEKVCGRILNYLAPHYEAEKPDRFTIGREAYDGVDWIFTRHSDTAYIECKAKRLGLKGRVAERESDLHDELKILAEAVVQNYANIQCHWIDRGSPAPGSRSYCVVVTLEDWLLFSDPALAVLDDFVRQGLVGKGLDPALPSSVPYYVMSAETLQYCVAVLESHEMRQVFDPAAEDEFKGWPFANYLKHRFPDLHAEHIGGFDSEFKALFAPYIERFGKVADVTYLAPELGDPAVYR